MSGMIEENKAIAVFCAALVGDAELAVTLDDLAMCYEEDRLREARRVRPKLLEAVERRRRYEG